MMQGDEGSLGFSIVNNAGQSVTPADIRDLEITIGPLEKAWSRAQLTFHEGKWMFPITQAESFGLWPGSLKAQVRICWLSGVVEGKPIRGFSLGESMSKEVL